MNVKMFAYSSDIRMVNPNISRVLKKLGFFYVEEGPNSVVVGHVPDFMIEAVFIDAHGKVIGGPYADLVSKGERALDLYDADKDRVVYGTPSLRERFFEEISRKSGLPLDVVLALTR